ncbi:hypothetical protein [Nocardiopsis protaetiae]|uniref:hypothetical protein n=1 Tax=Nocardiopsis protaetiae TaxID=3382270 RepID=UPI00387B7FA1
MDDPISFRDETVWLNGFYQLAIEVGSRDDGCFGALVESVSAAAGVGEWYRRRDVEPEEQVPVACAMTSFRNGERLFGKVTLPNGRGVVCGLFAIRPEEYPHWLVFYIPGGALERVGLAYEDGVSWYRSGTVDDWFAEIGAQAFARVPFLLGVIGLEVSALTSAEELGGSPEKWHGTGFLIPGQEGLRYHPARENG